jgi:enolase
MRIRGISALQIFDSRGNPTIEAEVTLDDGAIGRGFAPSGASTGQYEAVELRDGDASRLRGKSVYKAIKQIVDEIAPALRGMNALDQREIDQSLLALDKTANKSRLGANAILAVSMAVANAAANSQGKPLFVYLAAGEGTLLPLPQIQMIGGGAHADWRVDIQDYLIIPSGANSYGEALEIAFNVYHTLGDLLKQRGLYRGLADEGGYWPEFLTNEEPLELLVRAIERAGYTAGRDAAIALDIAASGLYDTASDAYRFRSEKRQFSARQFCDLLCQWCDRYPILSIEDPMADTDWSGWEQVYASLGHKIQLVGDDLFTTNLARIRQGIGRHVANAVLIKLNQIGTVTETLDAIRFVQQAGWLPIISARSGETEDAFISHLAVSTNAGQLKVGSFARSERMAKWNEVLRIERALASRAKFQGSHIFAKILNSTDVRRGNNAG